MAEHATEPVDHQHAFLERVEDDAVARLRLAQRQLGTGELGDVGRDADHAAELALLVRRHELRLERASGDLDDRLDGLAGERAVVVLEQRGHARVDGLDRAPDKVA